MTDDDRSNFDAQGQAKTKAVQIRPLWVILIILAAMALTFTITALLMSIFQHQQESAAPVSTVTALDDTTYDPAVWEESFPSQYETWAATSDFTPTSHSKELEELDREGDPRTEPPRGWWEMPRPASKWQCAATREDDGCSCSTTTPWSGR